MLIAILNCCTKEELEEEDETPEPITPEAAIEEAAADSSAETDSGESQIRQRVLLTLQTWVSSDDKSSRTRFWLLEGCPVCSPCFGTSELLCFD